MQGKLPELFFKIYDERVDNVVYTRMNINIPSLDWEWTTSIWAGYVGSSTSGTWTYNTGGIKKRINNFTTSEGGQSPIHDRLWAFALENILRDIVWSNDGHKLLKVPDDRRHPGRKLQRTVVK